MPTLAVSLNPHLVRQDDSAVRLGSESNLITSTISTSVGIILFQRGHLCISNSDLLSPS